MSESLSGLVVIELGSTIAGPFCARLFADFGARVIKVEDPRGDVIRSMGPQVDGHSLYAASMLRNKSAVAIDLREEKGRQVVRQLISHSDIVIENFRPGTMEGWGLDYESLAADNPRLIMVRISGFGQTGPYSHRPGYGVIGEAVSGLRSLIGDPDRPPSRVGAPLTDYITGLYAAFGAMAAIEERRRSGRGQVVDAALSECAFSMMESFVPAYGRLGIVPVRAGSRFAGAAPNNLYLSGDGQYVHIAAFGEALFRRLCEAMEQPHLASDERFCSGMARADNVEALDAVVAAWVSSLDAAIVEDILQRASVPASRIFSLPDIFSNEHFLARGMLLRVKDPNIGELTLAAPVPHLSRTPAKVHHPGRPIGADTREILSGMIGLSDEEIDALLR
jgi:crotonobetainyl-CoA:carnitine CoA-transferase CaiB-like acyl-CoA transferase